MGKYGKFDFKELEELQKKMQQLESKKDEYLKLCTKELAARLLRAVKKNTPVGQYPSGSGKVGGTLRRGWTISEMMKEGDTYKIEITNPIEYASYVEYGHRKRNHKGWTEGKFMLTISEQEIKSITPRLLEDKLKKMLGECLK